MTVFESSFGTVVETAYVIQSWNFSRSKCKCPKKWAKNEGQETTHGNLSLILHFTPHRKAKDFLWLDIVSPIMNPGVKLGTLLYELPLNPKGKNFVWKIYCYFPQNLTVLPAEGKYPQILMESAYRR